MAAASFGAAFQHRRPRAGARPPRSWAASSRAGPPGGRGSPRLPPAGRAGPGSPAELDDVGQARAVLAAQLGEQLEAPRTASSRSGSSSSALVAQPQLARPPLRYRPGRAAAGRRSPARASCAEAHQARPIRSLAPRRPAPGGVGAGQGRLGRRPGGPERSPGRAHPPRQRDCVLVGRGDGGGGYSPAGSAAGRQSGPAPSGRPRARRGGRRPGQLDLGPGDGPEVGAGEGVERLALGRCRSRLLVGVLAVQVDEPGADLGQRDTGAMRPST